MAAERKKKRQKRATGCALCCHIDALASVLLPTPLTLTLPLAAGGCPFADCIDPETAALLPCE